MTGPSLRLHGDLDSRREFLLFKTQETLRKKETSKKQREDQVNELKNFSESLRVRYLYFLLSFLADLCGLVAA